MKSFIFSLTAVVAISFTSVAFGAYEPYRFKCVYDANTDGMVTVTSKVDPDMDNMTLSFVSSINGQISEMEAQNVFVYYKDEEMNEDTKKVIAEMAKKLNIDQSQWFTTTEFVMMTEQILWTFYKFNSEKGTLGIGTYVLASGFGTYTECK